MKEITLKDAVDRAIANAGGISALSRLTGISRGHYHKIREGTYTNVYEKTCKALGVVKVTKYYLR